MAYRIDYVCAVPQKRTGRKYLLRLQLMTSAFLLMFALLTCSCWPEGAAKLRDYLLPEAEMTQTVLEDFVVQLNEGIPVGEALTAFCRQMIANGQSN